MLENLSGFGRGSSVGKNSRLSTILEKANCIDPFGKLISVRVNHYGSEIFREKPSIIGNFMKNSLNHFQFLGVDL